jgi:hypothetical protein
MTTTSLAPARFGLWRCRSGLCAAAEDDDFPLDMDAPPDVFAALNDGTDRKASSLSAALKGKRRIFVCGLALDFCVMDTCLNAKHLGFEEVHLVLDAARAAHIPGIGQFEGFLSDPAEVHQKLTDAGIKLSSVETVTGETPLAIHQSADPFPTSLGPLEVTQTTKLKIKLVGSSRYSIDSGLESLVERKTLLSKEGPCSPRANLPTGWPGAPAGAVRICWAYPIDKIADGDSRSFLAITHNTALQLAAYGGFLLLDSKDNVLSCQPISLNSDGNTGRLAFEAPRAWRTTFSAQLDADGRFQPVTLPSLKAAGAESFCWINPSEVSPQPTPA